jgi:hypothetical protein
VLHVPFGGREDLRVRIQTRDELARVKDMKRPTPIPGQLRKPFGFHPDTGIVGQHEPRCAADGTRRQRHVDLETIRVDAIQTPPEIVARVFARPRVEERIDEAERQYTVVVQQRHEIREKRPHLTGNDVGKHRVRQDVVETPGDRRQRERPAAVGIERVVVPVVKHPERLRKIAAPARNRVARHVDAPIALLVDRALPGTQHIADVAAEVEDVLALPLGMPQLRVEVSELAEPCRNVRHDLIVSISRRYSRT